MQTGRQGHVQQQPHQDLLHRMEPLQPRGEVPHVQRNGPHRRLLEVRQHGPQQGPRAGQIRVQGPAENRKKSC